MLKSPSCSCFLSAFFQLYVDMCLQEQLHQLLPCFSPLSAFRQLNRALWFQEQLHQSGLDAMLRAERQSLLTELEQLQSRLSQLRLEQQDLQAQMAESLAQQEETASNKTWKLQREGIVHCHTCVCVCAWKGASSREASQSKWIGME